MKATLTYSSDTLQHKYKLGPKWSNALIHICVPKTSLIACGKTTKPKKEIEDKQEGGKKQQQK